MHRWREIATAVQNVLEKTFDIGAPPIRYYCSSIYGVEFSSKPQALPTPDDGNASSYDLRAPICRLRDPWDHKSARSRDMGVSFSLKDTRGRLGVGTIGCFVRLEGPDGRVLPQIFGLTCHHIVCETAEKDQYFDGSGPEVIHPGQKDHENSVRSLKERKHAYEQELKEIQNEESASDKRNPARSMTSEQRRSTRDYLLRELENDDKRLHAEEQVGSQVIGRLWAQSGQGQCHFIATKTFPNDAFRGLPWISDWAIIEMNPDAIGENIVSAMLV